MSPDASCLLDRRHALKLLGGLGLVALGACATHDDTPSASSTTTSSGTSGSTSTSTKAASTDPIPEETAGPYPGDGSNGPNVLDDDGIVRRDITSSFGSLSGTADGVPLTIDLTVLDAAKGTPLAGAAVYLWHCDRQGRYSLYSSGATNQNYLRGVQVADTDGRVSFTSIFPAAYAGRWPHIDFEVYPTRAEATSAEHQLATVEGSVADGYTAALTVPV